MGLEVVWTNFAKSELRNIFDFHNEKVNLKIARQIVKEIVLKAKGLGKFPEMGAVEPLLLNKSQGFRYYICSNYKIIYWINNSKNRIEIMDIYDTRLNPDKISRKK